MKTNTMKLYLSLSFVLLSSICVAQTLYFNGKVFTGNPQSLWADYFIVQNGIITETGKGMPAHAEEIQNRVDLQSKLVIPGIVDSHIHFIDGGLTLIQINLNTVSNVEDLEKRLQESSGQTIDGFYVARDLAASALRGLSHPRELLDRYFPEMPAVIFLKSGHEAIANTAALTRTGMYQKSDVAGVQIDEKMKPTGYLAEAAAMKANQFISSVWSQQTVEHAIAAAQQSALHYGITLIGDNTFDPYHYKIYQEMQKEGALRIRIRARSYGRIAETRSLMQGLGKRHLGFIGGGVDPTFVSHYATKQFVDQSLSATPAEATAEPGGRPLLNAEELKELFRLNPHSVFAFHVQGKQGIENILTAIRDTDSRERHIIDHAGYCSDSLLKDIASRKLAVTMIGGQIFDAPSLSRYYQQQMVEFRQADFLNSRSKFRIAGAALTSDFPYGMDTTFIGFPQVDGLNPFANIAAATTGRYPDGSPIEGTTGKTLDADEALLAYTTKGAYAVMLEDKSGKIDQGYRADFVILDNDPFSEGKMSWYHTTALETYINGTRVFKAGEASTAYQPIRSSVLPSDYVISPVIGYDPSLGIILGGAYFRFPLRVPGRYFDAQLQVISKGKFNFQTTYTAFEIRPKLNLNVSASYSTFFQYYFGEGNQTSGDHYSVLYADNLKIRPELQWKFGNHRQINFFADVRGRKETGATDQQGTDLGTRFLADGTGAALGASFQKDTRDNTFSSRTGTLKLIGAQYIPAAWNTAGSGSVAQVYGEVRHFRSLHDSRFVLATRLAAAWSFGSPDYMYRYALGGSYVLRGYYNNRFRGDRYYAGQLELRFPLYKRFSGVAFADAGDVADDGFRKPKWTWGGGLRFALSEHIKLRLDYGIAKDQRGVFFTFSEAF
ncbi:MAG: amidohydrolase family protein [Bacteroidetes bacterium]|nr:amidohydrolase family protein [Bacteroidota bacterium]